MTIEINLTPTASLLEIERLLDNSDASLTKRAPIKARTWGPASGCYAGALLVHGLGAHSGWFEAMGRRLKVNRIFVLAYDQIGFGKRQNIDLASYDDWIEDLVAAYEYQQGAIGDKPLYVMANSMGAAVALKAISRKRIKPAGLALFSPGLEGNHETFKLTYRLRALFQALTAPESLLTLPYGPDLVTRDEFVRKWIANDPDMRLTMPAKILLEILKMTRGIVGDARNVQCPTLMLNAGIDKLVDTSLNQRFFQKLGAMKKSQHTYEQAFHDLMFDPVLDEVVSALLAWMKELSATAGSA